MVALTLKPTKWTDQEWIAALTAHRDDAWALLRDTIHRGLSVYVREHAREPDQTAFVVGLVEDATQDALLAVRAKLETFRGESRFTTWVYRVAVNVLLGQLRRRRWEAREPTRSPAFPDWPLDEQAPSPARAATTHCRRAAGGSSGTRRSACARSSGPRCRRCAPAGRRTAARRLGADSDRARGSGGRGARAWCARRPAGPGWRSSHPRRRSRDPSGPACGRARRASGSGWPVPENAGQSAVASCGIARA